MEKFIKNKYLTMYYNIINNGLSRNTMIGYSERHHIVPLSVGGPDTHENIVTLTAREHFICHLLLPKFTIGSDRFKMIRAHIMMSGRKTYFSRSYESFRKEYSEYTSGRVQGENNPFYGIDRKKENNAFYGKRHTDETKRKISEKRKGHSDNKGIPKSTEHKNKLSEAKKGSGVVYNFEHADGRQFSGTATELSALLGTNPAESWKLATGRYKSHRGWKLIL